MSTTDTRAAFEVQQENDYSPVYLGKNNCGDYADGEVQGRWLAWKAALDWQAATEAAKATGTAGELDEHQKFIDSLDDEDKMFEQIDRWARESYLRHKSSIRGQQITHADSERAHVIWATLRWAEQEAARQPAPVVAVKRWEDRVTASGLPASDAVYDAAKTAEIEALRAALAATAAPVLSDEQINDLWNALPGIEIHNKASAQGMSTDYALRIAFAKAIIAATRSQP